MSETTGSTATAPSSGASTAASTESTATASTPASATATPVATSTTTAAPAQEPGPIPYSRFKEVNDQLSAARKFQEQYGWAEQFQRDPAFAYQNVEQWLDQLAGHGEFGPKLLAKAARMLQSRRGQTPAAAPEEPQPDVPVMDAQGNVVNQTYSAPQLKKWQDWNWQQREAALSERLSPLEQMKSAIEKQQRETQAKAESHANATSYLERRRQDAVFKEHEPAFKAFFAEHEEYGDNVDAAWWDFYSSTVMPGLSSKAQAQVLDQMQTQANGATVSPGGANASGTPKFKDFKEAMAYFEKHPEEASRMAHR